MDAIRLSDGAHILLKWIRPSEHPYEVEIGTFFSSKPLSENRQNHCIPICDVLKVPGDDDKVILVMPMLRRFNQPQFRTYGEAVDFFTQFFEVREILNDFELIIAHAINTRG